MTNRRQFLKNASLIAATGVLASRSSVSAASLSIPGISNINAKKSFGLQTYSLTVNMNDREFSSNVAGGLKKVAQMGYSTIELAGYSTQGKIGGVTMEDYKKMADDAGLKIVSSHLNPPVREYSRDTFDKIKEFWKTASDHHAAIGCKYIIQPMMPPIRSTEDVAFIGEVFNESGKIAKAAGLTFGYHNHSMEFVRVVPGGTEALPVQLGGGMFRRPIEGEKMIYDGLLAATDSSLVLFELDVYWCVMGMQDPVAYMKKYPNRIRVLHIKDVAVLGESGMMNFKKIFETAYTNGISDFIVELENYPEGTQFEGVKGCADFLLNSDFVK